MIGTGGESACRREFVAPRDSLLYRKRSKWLVDHWEIHAGVNRNSGLTETFSRRAGRFWLVSTLAWILLFSFPCQAPAQDAPPPPDQSAAAPGGTGTLATVHGIVRNSATGQPLPRALVRIDGDATSGALTDGEGRFEIPGVPVGPQQFEVVKPGFLDWSFSDSGTGVQPFLAAMASSAHNVIVAAEMPDVVFTLSPTNAIQGQIQLSTGDPAEGMSVVLLRHSVDNGRFVWSLASTSKTTSDGTYRFGDLPEGDYAVYTNPAMDSEPATNLIAKGDAANVVRSGYASQFYQEARNIEGAARIRVSGGEQAEANLSLALEPFQAVTATLTFPGGRQGLDPSPGVGGAPISTTIMDAQGHQLPYTAQYDPLTRTVQAFLPDGNYTLVVTAAAPHGIESRGTGSASFLVGSSMVGAVDFSVSGHAMSNLRVPLTAIHMSPVQVNVMENDSVALQPGGGERGIFITLSQTGGWMADGMLDSYATGPVGGPLNANFLQPGRYWAHTNIADKHYCEVSLTAGGANLAREPLVLGLAGPVAPLTLTMREDCATLTLTLPATAAIPASGEEPYYTVYAVPDFDSTMDVVPETLRASTGGKIVLTGLTPGNYHVYAFEGLAALAYRDPAAMAAPDGRGQAVTLAPSSKTTLALEVPEH
jgi:hypothetical protein